MHTKIFRIMFVTLTGLVVTTQAFGQSATSQITIRGLMSAEEFRKAGLEKLTEPELKALDSWFVSTTARLVTNLVRAQTGRGIGSSGGFAQLEGATIVAEDGTFLGKITTNSLDPKSLLNEIGRYGSSISSTSIFNQIGRYGSGIGSMSPFSLIASTPPRIFLGNQFVAYLTVNSIKMPRVDPRALIGWLKANQ